MTQGLFGRYVLKRKFETVPWRANGETGLTAVSLFLIYRPFPGRTTLEVLNKSIISLLVLTDRPQELL